MSSAADLDTSVSGDVSGPSEPSGPLTSPLAAVLAPWLEWLSRPGGSARSMLSDEGPVIVACSGGCDSSALLALAVAMDWAPIAVHVDHGLRDGSADDARGITDLAARLGVLAIVEQVEIAGGRAAPNLEERARQVRYATLERVADTVGAGVILVAHTRDDQAETVLLNLLRGSASAGLAGMASRRGRIVRPLLGLGRRDTLEICARLGIDAIVDPMNNDTRFRRVWVRRELLPLLDSGASRDVTSILARQADVLRDESDYLDGVAQQALDGLSAPAGGDDQGNDIGIDARCSRELDAAGLAELPRVIARRVIRLWLGPQPPSLAQVDAVLHVAGGLRRAVELPGARRVAHRRGRLELTNTDTDTDDRPGCERATLVVPGETTAGSWCFTAWIERAAPVAWPGDGYRCVLDADTVSRGLTVRPTDPGDRLQPFGMAGHKTVAAALAETGIVAPSPTRWPVIADGATGEIVWVPGYRLADPARVTSATRRYLWIEAHLDSPAPER